MKRYAFLALALLALAFHAGSAKADGTLDGVIGTTYGSALSTDASGESNVSGANAILDTTAIYAYKTTDSLFVAVQVTGDMVATTWGHYYMYIQTDNSTETVTNTAGHPWGNVSVNANATTFKPDFIASVWATNTGADLHKWTGGAWASVASSGSGSWLGFAATAHVLEFKIALAAIGSPNEVQLEAFSADGSGHVMDTVPSDFNGDWSSAAVLTTPTPVIYTPVELSAFSAE